MTDRICTIEGCERKVLAREWCQRHYRCWYVHGDPLYVSPPRVGRRRWTEREVWASLQERLWAKVDKDGPVPPHRPDLGPCWVWTGRLNEKGYGRMGTGRRMVYVHRASWETLVGPIPDGLFVCHHCDNPPCVNPAHLFLGTQTDNMRDASDKGRLKRVDALRGSDIGNAVLTEDQVREIKIALATSGTTGVALAAQYGVSTSAISLIRRGKNWRHIAWRDDIEKA